MKIVFYICHILVLCTIPFMTAFFSNKKILKIINLIQGFLLGGMTMYCIAYYTTGI
jgi:hypothetical protein